MVQAGKSLLGLNKDEGKVVDIALTSAKCLTSLPKPTSLLSCTKLIFDSGANVVQASGLLYEIYQDWDTVKAREQQLALEDFNITKPVITIISPKDTDEFAFGSLVTFEGRGEDADTDGPLFGDELVWVSNLDGEIGRGTFFTTNSLTVGTHIITLTGTDPDGHFGRKKVSIIIGNEAPRVKITWPKTNSVFAPGENYNL